MTTVSGGMPAHHALPSTPPARATVQPILLRMLPLWVLLSILPLMRTSPARFDTGQSCVGSPVSRVGVADRVATRSALDAGEPTFDARPVAEGAEPAAGGATGTVRPADPIARSRPDLDLDDTCRCPLGPGCESCGAVDDLALATAGTPVGVFCLTLCGSCADAGDLPVIGSWSVAAVRVGEHCEHLGVDLDQAAAAHRRSQ